MKMITLSSLPTGLWSAGYCQFVSGRQVFKYQQKIMCGLDKKLCMSSIKNGVRRLDGHMGTDINRSILYNVSDIAMGRGSWLKERDIINRSILYNGRMNRFIQPDIKRSILYKNGRKVNGFVQPEIINRSILYKNGSKVNGFVQPQIMNRSILYKNGSKVNGFIQPEIINRSILYKNGSKVNGFIQPEIINRSVLYNNQRRPLNGFIQPHIIKRSILYKVSDTQYDGMVLFILQNVKLWPTSCESATSWRSSSNRSIMSSVNSTYNTHTWYILTLVTCIGAITKLPQSGVLCDNITEFGVAEDLLPPQTKWYCHTAHQTKVVLSLCHAIHIVSYIPI